MPVRWSAMLVMLTTNSVSLKDSVFWTVAVLWVSVFVNVLVRAWDSDFVNEFSCVFDGEREFSSVRLSERVFWSV